MPSLYTHELHNPGDTYNKGCRCAECRHAESVSRAAAGKEHWRRDRGDCNVVGNISTAYSRRKSEYLHTIPDGHVVYAVCGNNYCINQDHAGTRPKVIRDKWKPYVDAIEKLEIGQHVDFLDLANDVISSQRFRSAMANMNRIGHVRLSTRSLGASHGIRVYRVGTWGSAWKGREDVPAQFRPQFMWGWVRPWQRPTLIWLGQFYFTSSPSLVKRIDQCVVKGCIFPHVDDYGLCSQHLRQWEEWYWFVYGDVLDNRDFFYDSEPDKDYSFFTSFYEDSIYQLEQSLIFVGPDGRIDSRHKTCDPNPTPYELTEEKLKDQARKRHKRNLKKYTRKQLDMERDEDLELNFVPGNDRDDNVYIYEELRENQDFTQLFG